MRETVRETIWGHPLFFDSSVEVSYPFAVSEIGEGAVYFSNTIQFCSVFFQRKIFFPHERERVLIPGFFDPPKHNKQKNFFFLPVVASDPYPPHF